MSNDWTTKLRDRLTDYQEPVKDDLWASIEQSLAQNSEKTKTSRVIPLRRFSIAAAIAALAVGGTYVYLHPWNEVEPQEVATISSHQNASNAKDLALVSSNSKQNLVEKIIHRLTPKAREDEEQQIDVASFANAGSNVNAIKTDASTESHPVPMTEKPQSKKIPSQAKNKVAEDNSSSHNDLLLASSYDLPQTSRHKKSSKWSMQFYGENGVISNSNSNNQAPMASSMPSSTPTFYADYMAYAKNLDPMLMTNYNFAANQYSEKKKHHQPISIGIQVGFGLNKRLHLTTGIVYTKTSTDFINSSSSDNSIIATQTLHYIGIPLNLNYYVWGTRSFHTYVTVGGEGAINVKNDTGSENSDWETKRDRMQWSGNASVGAQYDIIPQLGLYVEPGAKYYFDNGSDIENYFKYKKLNFNIQFGLRWNINKE